MKTFRFIVKYAIAIITLLIVSLAEVVVSKVTGMKLMTAAALFGCVFMGFAISDFSQKWAERIVRISK